MIDLPSKSVQICKILSGKHKAGVNDFISPTAPTQTAFIPRRRIAENVLLAPELVKNYHQERCLRSAFWRQFVFLRDSEIGLKLCITSPKYSVAINGNLEGYSDSRKGLR